MTKKIVTLFIFLLGSCNSPIIQLTLPQKNPTFYLFNSNISNVKKAINSSFNNFEFYRMILSFKEDSNPFSEEIFIDPINNKDAYLYSFDLLNSSIYFKDSKPLLYDVSFHIHLDSIDNCHTNVTVITIHPKVVVGTKFGLADNLKIRIADFRKVEPSTVEEYQILLRIGNALDEKQMPPLIMPSTPKKITKDLVH
jgi:hypothetical protein